MPTSRAPSGRRADRDAERGQRLGVPVRTDDLQLHRHLLGAVGITPSSLAGAVVTVDPPGGGTPITATVVSTVARPDRSLG